MGVIGGGCELMRYAWPKLDLLFSIRHKEETIPTDLVDPPLVRLGPHRSWLGLLENHPVDLLIIEKGNHKVPTRGPQQQPWEDMIASVSLKQRPTIVIESWRTDPTLWQYEPTSKASTTRWKELGYQTNCRAINATAVGGAIDQSRLLVIRTKIESELNWKWDSLDRDLSVIRPMSNLLTPLGLVPKRAYSPWGSPNTPKAFSDPMPHRIGAWIETEKGIRRLMKDELAQGLGIPKGAEEGNSAHSLHRSTSLFHWEYLSYSMERLKDHGTPGSDHGPRPFLLMGNPPLPSPRTRRSSHGAPPTCPLMDCGTSYVLLTYARHPTSNTGNQRLSLPTDYDASLDIGTTTRTKAQTPRDYNFYGGSSRPNIGKNSV